MRSVVCTDDASTSNTYDSSNILLIEDEEWSSDGEEQERTNTNPVKSYIPPWKVQPAEHISQSRYIQGRPGTIVTKN